jgi:hypothetical protein
MRLAPGPEDLRKRARQSEQWLWPNAAAQGPPLQRGRLALGRMGGPTDKGRTPKA